MLMSLYEFKDMQNMLKESSKTHNVELVQHIQTNGTHFTQDYITFFKENGIRVGISFDGSYGAIRTNQDLVLKNFDVLNCKGMSYGTICVITKQNMQHMHSIYEEMVNKKIPIRFNNYIRIGIPATDEKFLPDFEETVRVYCSLFDHWLDDSQCMVPVDPFYSMLSLILYKLSNICTYSSCLTSWVALDAEGNLTSCNRAIPKEYSYGNIFDYEDIDEVYISEGYRKLIEGATERRRKCKNTCIYFDYCRGGCNATAIAEGRLEDNGGFSCKFFFEVFSYFLNVVDQMILLGNEPKNPSINELWRKLRR